MCFCNTSRVKGGECKKPEEQAVRVNHQTSVRDYCVSACCAAASLVSSPPPSIARMATQLMGSSVRLPTRSPAFRSSQQPRTAISRPSVGSSSMHGSSYSSVSTAFGMPSANSSRTANRRVVTMAAKGKHCYVFLCMRVQLPCSASMWQSHSHCCCGPPLLLLLPSPFVCVSYHHSFNCLTVCF